jgi:hypothetical protein
MTLQEKIEQLSTQTEFDASGHETFNNFKTALQHKNFSDLISLNLHRVVAHRLIANSQLIKKAASNLDNWLNVNPNESAWLEWRDILTNESVENIVKIITADTDEGQRLRSSSPFAGLLTKQERQIIIEECEKAGLV